ncbi:hypothetical protein [Pseudorhodoferax sp. Leaf265]|uniref:hypothetical protein n=1 Tax=Pseudorhodoferax sp. Leaf265 TaxID=1736315 RepID=UPI0006FACDC8|nr:hypothetical protein [Pseudorhodoferax sp. Leaf265]KQP19959.1 hypothetical protein ASF45_22960 [Pseudorhodoferax sp. Leaf265]
MTPNQDQTLAALSPDPRDSTTPAPLVPNTATRTQIAQDRAAPLQAGLTQDSLVETLDEPAWYDVAGAVFMTETTVMQAALAMGAREGIGTDETVPHDWNLYSYYGRNREQYKDLEWLVLRGEFDGIRGERAFRAKAQVARENLRLAETIEKGGVAGHIAGMGLSLFDVTSLMSFGALARAGKGASLLSRATRGAAVGLGDSAVQEGALQYMDPTRSPEDAFMSIGTGTFLGAGLGSLFHHLPADSRLNPDHPQNPLRPDVPDNAVSEFKLGQTPEEGVTVGNRFGSMGAAGVDETATEMATGKGLGGMADKAFVKILGHGTPVARMAHYLPGTRTALTRLVDLGGRLTRAMANGQAHAPEAESLRTLYLQKGRATQTVATDNFRKLNMNLGQSAAATAANDTASRMTAGRWDRNMFRREAFDRMVFVEQSNRMLGEQRSQAEIVGQLQAQHGMSEADANMAYGLIRETANNNMAYYQELFDEAKKVGLAEDDVANLGGAYGLPVQYVRSAINEDRQGFKSALYRLLVDEPDASWLDEHLLTLVDHKTGADGKVTTEPRFKSVDELRADQQAWTDTLQTWRGDAERAARDAAEEAFESSQRKLFAAADVFNEAKVGLKAIAKEVKAQSAKAMKLQARAAEADWHGRNVGYAVARVEKAEAKIADLERRAGGDPLDLAGGLQRSLDDTGTAIDSAFADASAASGTAREADSLVQRLRGEKDPLLEQRRANVDPGIAQAHIDQINQELKVARAEREQAQRDLAEARGRLDQAAAEQAELQDWMTATAREIERHRKAYDEAELGAGYRDVLDGDMDRIQVLKQAAHDADQNTRFLREQMKVIKKGVKVTDAELDAAIKESRQARRTRRKLEGATPLSKYIDDLVSAMSGQDRFPAGLLLDDVPETGRFKERRFKWTKELWQGMADKGFVESDLGLLADRYARDVGGRLALHKALDGRKRADVLQDVLDEYDAAERAAKTEKERKRIVAMRHAAVKDVEASINRILGKHEIGDDGAIPWLAAKLGNLGYIRIAGGIVFTAMSDIATAIVAAPGFISGARKAGKEYQDILRRASAGDKDALQLRMILESFESGAHMASTINANGGGMRDHIGFGTGTTRAVSGKIDKMLEFTGERVNVLSGLAGLSNAVRRTAGLVQLANIQRWVKDWDNLSPAQQTDLAAIGIGKTEAKRMAQLFEKHGRVPGQIDDAQRALMTPEEIAHAESFKSTLFDPGMSKWVTEPDGDYMADVLNTALLKTQQRASYTSGFGHMPLMMDKAYGKLFFQFQSYAFQFTNNFVLAGMQRGAVTGDYLKLATALGTSFAMAGVVSAIRAHMRGEDPDTWDNSKWANEIVSRSGIMGWTQPYADAAIKLFGNNVNEILGGSYLQPTSKFQQNTWAESLLGPWFGTFGQGSRALGDLATGDLTAAGEKAFKLIPLNQQISVGGLLLEAFK